MRRLFYAVLTLMGIALVSCQDHFYVSDVEDTVVDVLDGNTLVLNSGLTVKLLGVAPNSQNAYDFLRTRVVGHEIALTPDSDQGEEFYTFDDVIWCYVYDYDMGVALNRKVLSTVGPTAYSGTFLTDSLDVYKKISSTQRQWIEK